MRWKANGSWNTELYSPWACARQSARCRVADRSSGIDEVYGIISGIGIEVLSAVVSDGIVGEEPPERSRVVACAIIVESCFGIEPHAHEAERVARRRRALAIGGVSVGLGERSRGTRDRDDRA